VTVFCADINYGASDCSNECGGADATSNMQWQTIAAGKAKDKTEGKCRL